METNANNSMVSKLIERYYPEPEIDTLHSAFTFYARSGMRVLDAGSGDRLACSRMGPWPNLHIVGVDRDPVVHRNPHCNETYVCDLSQLPFGDSSFDLIHCRWVVEHLEEPQKAFCEFARVLKSGGHLLVLTPNIFHYATIASVLTPHWIHRLWLQKRGEPFPTYYRANSPRALRRLCKGAGLTVERIRLIERQPYYLTRFWPAFICGILYERVVNSSRKLSLLRQRIFLDAFVSGGT